MADNGPVVVRRRRRGGLESFQPEVAPPLPLWETAIDTLRKAIIRGDLPAGVHLAEEELAARLGVSRGPVRQALVRLEHEGLVRILPRRGAVVLGFTEEDVREVYDLRRLIEAHAARRSAAHASAEALAELRALAGQVVESAETSRFGREVSFDLDFHRHLVAMAGHRRLLAAWEPLTATVQALLTVTQARMPGVAASHFEIVAALESRDPAAAEQRIIAHLDHAEQQIHGARRSRIAEAESATPRPVERLVASAHGEA